jgi:hypothetical protein
MSREHWAEPLPVCSREAAFVLLWRNVITVSTSADAKALAEWTGIEPVHLLGAGGLFPVGSHHNFLKDFEDYMMRESCYLLE